MRQVHRFVAPMSGHRLQIARQKIGGVSFDQQSFGRNVSNDIPKMMTAPFIADPTRDADVQTEIEIGACFVETGGEAVSNAADELRMKLVHDAHEIVVRIALMQENWFL